MPSDKIEITRDDLIKLRNACGSGIHLVNNVWNDIPAWKTPIFRGGEADLREAYALASKLLKDEDA